MSEAMRLANCPFCGSKNIDAAGWATLPQYAKTPEERNGPACDDCGATAETVEKWNIRASAQPCDERLRGALDNSQSLLTMLLLLGDDHTKGISEADWTTENLSKLVYNQIIENRRALSAPSAPAPRGATSVMPTERVTSPSVPYASIPAQWHRE